MTDFTETRSMLKRKALAEKGDTPIRRAAHNLLEMTENWEKHPEQRPQLEVNIQRELARFEQLRQSKR
jgi:hypothetical protein